MTEPEWIILATIGAFLLACLVLIIAAAVPAAALARAALARAGAPRGLAARGLTLIAGGGWAFLEPHLLKFGVMTSRETPASVTR